MRNALPAERDDRAGQPTPITKDRKQVESEGPEEPAAEEETVSKLFWEY